MHKWVGQKPTSKGNPKSKCSKCGLIRIREYSTGRNGYYTYKRGNKHVYGDDPFGRNTPKCIS